MNELELIVKNFIESQDMPETWLLKVLHYSTGIKLFSDDFISNLEGSVATKKDKYTIALSALAKHASDVMEERKHFRYQNTPAVKIIGKSNFDNEMESDRLVCENVLPCYAKTLVKALNDTFSGEDATYYFFAASVNYKLHRFDPNGK